MNSNLGPMIPSTSADALHNGLVVYLLRPFTKDGRVMIVRLVATLLSLAALFGILAWLMFGPFARIAWSLTPLARASSTVSAPEPTRIVETPMERDANFSWVKPDRHVDPLEEVGIDPHVPKDRHIDPLEDVGIDPHVPKDPHVDPLEDVGIDPVPAATPFEDVEDTLPDIAGAGIVVGR